MAFDKVTEYHPDTCGCVIEYHWDRDTTEDERVHTCLSVVPCPLHAHLPPGIGSTDQGGAYWTERHTVWHAVFEENRRKSLAEAHAMTVLRDTHVTVTRKGVREPTEAWAEHVEILWWFDDDERRTLHLRVDPSTVADAEQVQAKLDAEGLEAVVIEASPGL